MRKNSRWGIERELETLGRAIRRRRRQLKLTQAELAGLCGVGVRFVSELESGKPGLEFGRAVHVMQQLGLELELRSREKKEDTDTDENHAIA
jgi:HTH-type transcriptional regulator / antitoxin HipB